MSRSNYKTLTFKYHQNVINTIIKFFNYRWYPDRSYRIVYRELKRTGMTDHSVMVLCQHRYKLVHRICHNVDEAYRMSCRFHRKVIVHMLTGKYLEIVVDSTLKYKELPSKLQPVCVKNNKPTKYVLAVMPIVDDTSSVVS